MSNYKIRVNGKSESKEVQELFFELGYSWNGNKKIQELSYPVNDSYWLCTKNGMGLFNCIKWGTGHDSGKLITLPDLRDLVVLKRNYREDANVLEDNCLYDLYLTKSRELYFYHCGKNKWILSNLNGDDFYYELLKPIEKKEMKEYLDPENNYRFNVTDKPFFDWIEIPDGANFAWKSDGKYVFFTALEMGYRDASVVWSRHTHPEELPFIDDEPSQSLNDQYAEIEKVRQSAWNKQEGGSHYKNLKIQPMQYALENKLDYAQANVVKYVTRHADKNGKEDLLKAIHNLELMIEFYYGDEK